MGEVEKKSTAVKRNTGNETPPKSVVPYTGDESEAQDDERDPENGTGSNAPVDQPAAEDVGDPSTEVQPTLLSRSARVVNRITPGAVAVVGIGQERAELVPGNLTDTSIIASLGQEPADLVPPPPPPQASEHLLEAHLVEERDQGDIVHAERAKTGINAFVSNPHFKYVAVFFFVLLLAVIVPLATLLPGSRGTTVDSSSSTTNSTGPCGTRSLGQSDYRGPINATQDGIECQPWAAQYPHDHFYAPENYPDAGLEGNACRNPNPREPRAWCYSVHPEIRKAYCDVPSCPEEVLETDCGRLLNGQKEYRGNLSVTRNGRACQRWDSQHPHRHSLEAQNYPNSGLEENFCRNPEGERFAYCLTTDPNVRWETCDIPDCGEAEEESLDSNNTTNATSAPDYDYTKCGTRDQRQQDYRGNIEVSWSGWGCQAWNMMMDTTSWPLENLTGNYCRNPGQAEEQAWCYTTEPTVPYQRCNIPYCDDTHVYCGSPSLGERDYAGTVARTLSGAECQRWDSQLPHQHVNTPEEKPNSGLMENYCRNPDGATNAWCYTTDPKLRWEFCDVPKCNTTSSDTHEHQLTQCGTPESSQADYRGPISVTSSGLECQAWDSQYPHNHTNTPEGRPSAGLEENYCRNPDGEPRTWCYTTDPGVRWDYCEVPLCEKNQPTSMAYDLTVCGTELNKQSDYRGNVSVSKSGLECQAWDTQIPHGHVNTPGRWPFGGLVENYCRNPDGGDAAWCYTTNTSVRFEYCNVPICDERHQFDLTMCGLEHTSHADYRGNIAVTVSGLECQEWTSQLPHQHKNTPDRLPNAGLEENFCRNPDGEPRAWCYTTNSSVRWEYCNVPFCQVDP